MNKLVSIEEIVPIMKEQMAEGGKVSFTPKGNSMLPLFRSDRDVVTLSPPRFPLKKYSIVFYQRKTDSMYSTGWSGKKNPVILCGEITNIKMSMALWKNRLLR